MQRLSQTCAKSTNRKEKLRSNDVWWQLEWRPNNCSRKAAYVCKNVNEGQLDCKLPAKICKHWFSWTSCENAEASLRDSLNSPKCIQEENLINANKLTDRCQKVSRLEISSTLQFQIKAHSIKPQRTIFMFFRDKSSLSLFVLLFWCCIEFLVRVRLTEESSYRQMRITNLQIGGKPSVIRVSKANQYN